MFFGASTWRGDDGASKLTHPTCRCCLETGSSSYKQSGYGREQGEYGLQSYTEIKSVIIPKDMPKESPSAELERAERALTDALATIRKLKLAGTADGT
jgi:hypothetical protein